MKTQLDPSHRLQLELANERIQRAHAESRCAAAFVEVAELRAHIARISISHEYGLVDGDHMNFSTGEITRKPNHESPPAAATPPAAPAQN